MILSKALSRDLLISVGFVAALALVPIVFPERYFVGQIITFLIWSMVASQWNLLMGHAGVFSLAQMAFFAIGAYTTAMASRHLDLSIWMSLPLAVLVAMVSALIVGAACLRLHGAYVALLTFAIAEVIHVLIITDTYCYTREGGGCLQFFGGATGFSRISDFGFRPFLKGDWILGNYYVVLLAFAFVTLVTMFVMHGRLGLAFRAIRDNLGYASSRGISRFYTQMTVFAISAALTGLAGWAYAGHFRFAGPSLFDFSTLILVLSMVIVGGLGSIWGPYIGAATILIGLEWLKEFGDAKNIGLGLILVLVVLFAPNGLAALFARLFKHIRPGKNNTPKSRT
ncbi:branched-chain amino acid ABC transporter permease [uncultured Roseovarius sp.]|uniref:branched-chain amino acid ABC transporter permease n=1 Tax=uncultured Roseovarius sp. TaxID=293344 RepID=UPI00262C510A|nr:branched-chain amino acid ABC transporter permease [uncultured Roseovarius sp.]